MKTVLTFVVVVVICSTSLGGVYDRLEQRFLPKTSGLIVLNTPPDVALKKEQSAYQGLHPRQQARPAETFPFPIKLNQTGPVTPLFSAPNQYPFICDTQHSGLGQPLVDNQDKQGIAVFVVNDNDKKN